ncbi:MAG: hypothetical protein HC806_01975 [Anaerolineae bacterium]|nr:hypothetical protein [Anaerolineae bacterium]
MKTSLPTPSAVHLQMNLFQFSIQKCGVIIGDTTSLPVVTLIQTNLFTEHSSSLHWSQNPPSEWFITNKFDVTPYLGRINFVSILPSGFLLAGLALGIFHLIRFLKAKPDPTITGNALIALIIIASMAGYFWFLVRYPALDKGDTIKATYMIHIFPLLAILAGQVLQKINHISPRLSRLTIILLFSIFIHNLPAMVTRFIPWHLLAYYPPFRWITAYLPWQ